MARRWMGVALLAGWLGVSASAHAQFPPAPPGAPGPVFAPPGDAAGPAPGYDPGHPGGDWCPPPLPDGPPAECLPANAFSNIHPEEVGRSPRLYFGADYLLWWVRKRQIPPLVSQGSLDDLFPGALGSPGSRAFLGPGSADNANHSGARFTLLYWLDQDHNVGLDGSLTVLEQRTARLAAGGFGDVDNFFLARPFFNPNTGIQDADPLVVPGVQAGSLAVTMPRRFLGAETNLRLSQDVSALSSYRMTLLAGARFLFLDEKLLISEGVIDLPDINNNPGNITTISDNFVTYNRFYGGQLGLEMESRFGPLRLTLTGKVAVGVTSEVIKISGTTLVTEPGGPVTLDPTRGLLAQPTNVGRFTRNQFAAVPEVGLNLAWEFNEHLRVSLGYTFLYWTDVARPGDQIDTTVNIGAVAAPAQFGTSPRPGVPFHTTGFWAQGLTAGVQVSY